jgi:uncharacterized protein YjiS (DUF1127 family)
MLFALADLLQKWRRYNRGLLELSRLDDRELADLGIIRSDIPWIAWEHSDRDRRD